MFLIKKFKVRDYTGQPIIFKDKDRSYPRYIIGGIIFGLGWALTGACPGPMFVNLGIGYYSMLIVIFGALLGTFIYGLVKSKLPHGVFIAGGFRADRELLLLEWFISFKLQPCLPKRNILD